MQFGWPTNFTETYYSVRSVGYTRRAKKGADKPWARFDLSKIGLHSLFQRFILPEWRLADTLLPKMVPNKFIRIELRCVSGEKVKFQATFDTLDVVGNNSGDVCRMAVKDEEDGLSA